MNRDVRHAHALELENVGRQFGGVVAVDDVSLAVAQDERVAVIGPNGAGKTTLFKVIAGEISASFGTVSFFGTNVSQLTANKRARLGLSRTFQVSNLFADLRVEENVRLAAQASSNSRIRFWSPVRKSDAVGARVDEALGQVGLAQRRHQDVSNLSHGEKRQLELAMALVTQPALLLLDEPAAGLSGDERTRLHHLIQELPADLPVLLIEHDMSLALSLAHRVLCLHNGRSIALGAPEEVREDPLVQEVYLGTVGRNAEA